MFYILDIWDIMDVYILIELLLSEKKINGYVISKYNNFFFFFVEKWGIF